MPLLLAADFPGVRAALDATLGVDDLPDATIGLDVFAGEAERELATLDPLYATRTGDEATRVKAAATYLTASLLAPSLPVILEERFADYMYARSRTGQTTLAAMAPELRARAVRIVNDLLYPGNALAGVPAMFALACGRRGR